MPGPNLDRGLRAVMSVDMVGYGRAMEADEAGTHRRLSDVFRSVIEPATAAAGGSIVKTIGDGVLAEFPSAVGAVGAAIAIQRAMRQRAGSEPAPRIEFRIGIDVGDIIHEANDAFGDGVILATRLQALAEPGSIYVSRAVFEHVRGKVDGEFRSLGRRRVKNASRPVEVYRVIDPSAKVPVLAGLRRRAYLLALLMLVVIAGGLAVYYRGMLTPLVPMMSTPALAEPVVAVLPFDNLTGDPDRGYFVDGVTEDIITRLSKFSSIRVIARTSSFALRGSGLDIEEIGRRLGADYILEGSMQTLGAETRITAQLIRVAGAIHIWADAYDATGIEVFPVRDRITRAIVSTMMSSDKGQLQIAERRSAAETASLSAYSLLMLGWSHWYRETKEENEQARALFEKAIEIDPNYARAYSALAWTYANDYDNDWTDDYEAARLAAFENARKSLDLDDSDYKSHWVIGWAYLYNWEHEDAQQHYERALQLNPNDAELLAEMGNLLIYVGEPQRAIEQILLAMRLNPFHDPWYEEYLGWAYEEAGRPEDAVRVLSAIRDPEEWVRRTLAASYAAVGRQDEAAEEIRSILEDNPGFSLAAHADFVRENYPYKTEEQVERWLEALKRAGAPP